MKLIIPGPLLDATSDELITFVDKINGVARSWSDVEVRLDGVNRLLKNPQQAIEVMMFAIVNRCQNEDQMMACLMYIWKVASERHHIPITAERLIKATEALVNTEQEMQPKQSDREAETDMREMRKMMDPNFR